MLKKIKRVLKDCLTCKAFLYPTSLLKKSIDIVFKILQQSCNIYSIINIYDVRSWYSDESTQIFASAKRNIV